MVPQASSWTPSLWLFTALKRFLLIRSRWCSPCPLRQVGIRTQSRQLSDNLLEPSWGASGILREHLVHVNGAEELVHISEPFAEFAVEQEFR
jgi:hypothetical protein